MPDDDPGTQRRTIHIRIRDLRRERSLTQEELAAALGLSRQSINAMEAGRNLPSLPVAMQIASFFAVPVHAIFDLPDDSTSVLPTLTQWSPLREMREALDDLMQENANWAPVQIIIEVGDDFLTVASHASDVSSSDCFRREYARQPFERTLALPALVRSEEAEAVMRNGILTITIPKIVEEKPRTARISIRAEE